jgi:hypothetical protein
LQQFHVAGTDVGDVHGADPAVLPQAQADARQDAKKRAVHTLTLAEVDDEFLLPLLNPFERKPAQRLAVLERSAPDDANVNLIITRATNEDSFG